MNIVFIAQIIILIIFCILASIKDVKICKIPNYVPISLFVIWVLFVFIKWALAANKIIDLSVIDVLIQAACQVICSAVICCLLAACIIIVDKLNKKRGLPKSQSLGMGDIKLLMVVCLYLDIWSSFICLFIACLIFILYILFMRIVKHNNISTAPFAPFILIGVIFAAVIQIILF